MKVSLEALFGSQVREPYGYISGDEEYLPHSCASGGCSRNVRRAGLFCSVDCREGAEPWREDPDGCER